MKLYFLPCKLTINYSIINHQQQHSKAVPAAAELLRALVVVQSSERRPAEEDPQEEEPPVCDGGSGAPRGGPARRGPQEDLQRAGGPRGPAGGRQTQPEGCYQDPEACAPTQGARQGGTEVK